MISLTSTPYNDCPGPVNFTCVGTEITSSLFWLVNSSHEAAYGYRGDHVFPFVLYIDPPLDGVTAVITDVDGPTNNNLFNITSILSVYNVAALNGTSLRCEGSQDASNILIISLSKCVNSCKHLTSLHFSLQKIALHHFLVYRPVPYCLPLKVHQWSLSDGFPLNMLWRGIVCQ